MYPINQIEIQKSLARKGTYAEKVIQDQASFINGKTKVINYLLQDAPSGNSLPIFVIPPSEKFISLVSFMVNCKLPEEQQYICQHCFQRNECLRSILIKIQKTLSKMNKMRLSIDEIFDGFHRLRRTPRIQTAIDCLIQLLIELGEVKE